MEVPQGNFCVAIVNKQNVIFFSFILIQNQRIEGRNRYGLGVGVGTSGKGEEVGKGVGG
jgi:hypothetical protein